MARHGRRAQDTYQSRHPDLPSGPQQEHMAFKLQLKPQHATECSIALETVSAEYATRYLEQLGVSPARLTLDLVHKNIPLTEKNVITTLRAKGHVNDELQLSVPPVHHSYRVPKVIHTHAILQLGLTNQEAARSQSAGAATSSHTDAAGQGAHVHMQEGSHGDSGVGAATEQQGLSSSALQQASSSRNLPGSQFRHMAARYLHPFNLDVTIAQSQLQQLTVDLRPSTAEIAGHGAYHRKSSVTLQHQSTFGRRIQDAALNAQSPPSPSSPTSPQRSRSHDPSSPRHAGSGASSPRRPAPPTAATGWDPDLLRLEICEELLQEVSTTPEVVLMLCAQVERALVDWYTHQAPETLKGRLTHEQFKSTLELLTDEPRVCLFITLLNFMHQEYVRGSPSYPHHLEERVNRSRSLVNRAGSNSLSRSSSFRIAAGGGSQMLSAGLSAVSASRLQNLEKYDLGYKYWVKHRPQASSSTTAGQGRPRTNRQSPTPTPGQVAAPAAAGAVAAAAAGTGTPDGGASAVRRPRLHTRISFKDPFPSAPSPIASPRSQSPHVLEPLPQSPWSASARHSRSRSTQAAASLPPALMFAGDQQQQQQRAPSSPTVPEGGGRGSAAVGRQSPAPVSLAEATRRSMCHLPSVQALQAAVADGEAGPSQLTLQDEQQLQQARLLVLQREFAGLFAALRTSRAGMFFTLPVFLVTARLLLHLLFTGLYRLWVRTQEGHQAVQQMDEALEHLYDPHGYLQRNLSILQSSPTAVSVMAKYPHKSHEPERLHFADVSPLVRAVMVDPASPGARKLLHQAAANSHTRARQGRHPRSSTTPADDVQDSGQGGANAGGPSAQGYAAGLLQGLQEGSQGPIKTQLTLAQREELFQEVQALLLGQAPPDLAARGSPAGTTRDSWVPKPC